MKSSRFPSWILLVASCGVSGGACAGHDRTPVRVIDLLREIDHAEARPAPAAFEIAEFTTGAVSHPSIVTAAPSRLVFTLSLPRGATFRAAVAIGATDPAETGVRFRVGVSDERIYELLVESTLPAGSPGWTDIRADLSAYAGWKWSVFYRPDRRLWRLILSTDVLAGSQARAAWGVPGIDAGSEDARAYANRRDAVRQRSH